jgi:hypothetical protein
MILLVLSIGSALAVMCGLTWRRRLSGWLWTAWVTLTAVFAVAVAFHIVRATVAMISHPPAYDFMCFWVYGTAAVRFHDPYNPAALHASAALLGLVHDVTPHVARIFSRGVLDPGMLYPPTSILLFYPLGFLPNIHHAALVWWAMNLVALIALVLVMWRTYFNVTAGSIAAFVLVAGFLPTLYTLDSGQTAIFMTLFALLFLVDKSETRGGVWLALAVIAKPVTVLLVLYPLVKRQYRTLIGFAASAAVSASIAIAVTSVPSFMSYLTNNPTARAPGYMYLHPGHQSLFSVILRLSHDNAAHYRFLDNHVYVAIAGMLVAVSLWLCVKLELHDRPIAVALLASLSLLVYPITQHFYGMLLLITLGVLWTQYGSMRGKTAFVSLYWIAEVVLMGVSIAAVSFQALPLAVAPCAFVGFVLSWIVLAMIASQRVLSRQAISVAVASA